MIKVNTHFNTVKIIIVTVLNNIKKKSLYNLYHVIEVWILKSFINNHELYYYKLHVFVQFQRIINYSKNLL